MIYPVLGMHKSGTTLVAEILHASGVSMVEAASGTDYDQGNKWERAATSELNKRLLDGFGVDSIDLGPPARGVLESAEAEREARAVVAAVDATDWGFKDPRTCYTWPLWSRVLGTFSVIGVYRHYGAVADHHLKWASGHHKERRFWRSRVARMAVQRWIEHNDVVLEAVLANGEAGLLLSYERLMEGPEELERLERHLGRPLVDRRDPGLFRNRRQARPGHRWLARRVRWSGGGDAQALWVRLEAERERQASREPQALPG